MTRSADNHYAGSIPEALEGGRGFGSALQVVLRYLGGAALMPELADRIGSSATASPSGRSTANGLKGLSGTTYAGATCEAGSYTRAYGPLCMTSVCAGCGCMATT